MENKLVEIENEVDIRVESLKNEIETYRDKYIIQLAEYKENLKKLINLVKIQVFFFF